MAREWKATRFPRSSMQTIPTRELNRLPIKSHLASTLGREGIRPLGPTIQPPAIRHLHVLRKLEQDALA